MGAPVVGFWRKSDCTRVIFSDQAQSSRPGLSSCLSFLNNLISPHTPASWLIVSSQGSAQEIHLRERRDIDMNCNLAPVIFRGERRAELQCSVHPAGS